MENDPGGLCAIDPTFPYRCFFLNVSFRPAKTLKLCIHSPFSPTLGIPCLLHVCSNHIIQQRAEPGTSCGLRAVLAVQSALRLIIKQLNNGYIQDIARNTMSAINTLFSFQNVAIKHPRYSSSTKNDCSKINFKNLCHAMLLKKEKKHL